MLSKVLVFSALFATLCLCYIVHAVPSNVTSGLVLEDDYASPEYWDVDESSFDPWDEKDDFEELSNVTHLERRGPRPPSGARRVKRNIPMTYYWLALQKEYSKGGQQEWLGTCKHKRIARVSKDFANNIRMEGSGIVGKTLLNLDSCNCGSGYNCFFKLSLKQYPYGITAYSTPLRPFVTIAANDLKRGYLWIPQIVGWPVPGSKHKHNGCMLMDDQSWSFGGNHADFYTYSMAGYKYLDKHHNSPNVDIYYVKHCTLIKYI